MLLILLPTELPLHLAVISSLSDLYLSEECCVEPCFVMTRVLWHTREHGWAAALQAALSPNSWPRRLTAQAAHSPTCSAYSRIFTIMQKSTDFASVCIVELFLRLLRRQQKTLRALSSKARMTFLVSLHWRKRCFSLNKETIWSYAVPEDGK